MEQAIKDTKDKRSRQKARLTSTAKLMKTASNTQRATLFNTLNEIYAEFLNLHYQYCEMVESDDKYVADRTVNNLDLTQYLKSVDDTYTEACKSYATCLGLDVIKALKKADVFASELSAEAGVDTLYLMQQADAHMSQCRELSALSDSVQVFDSELAENFDKSVSSLGQALFKCRRQQSASRSVHFVENRQRAPGQNPGPARLEESNNDNVGSASGSGGGNPSLDVPPDRKSTRLNSSHTVISYAVFCLKKKKKHKKKNHKKKNLKKKNKKNTKNIKNTRE